MDQSHRAMWWVCDSKTPIFHLETPDMCQPSQTQWVPVNNVLGLKWPQIDFCHLMAIWFEHVPWVLWLTNNVDKLPMSQDYCITVLRGLCKCCTAHSIVQTFQGVHSDLICLRDMYSQETMFLEQLAVIWTICPQHLRCLKESHEHVLRISRRELVHDCSKRLVNYVKFASQDFSPYVTTRFPSAGSHIRGILTVTVTRKSKAVLSCHPVWLVLNFLMVSTDTNFASF